MTDTLDIAELVGEEPKSAIVAVRRFKPWHKPRKQFIREQQWASLLQGLLQKFKTLGQTRTVKYIGLPGEDMLDIRVFHDVVASMGEGWELEFLGFDATGTPDQNLADSITHDLPRVNSTRSSCKTWRLQLLAEQSKASACHRELKRFAAADVINIDLCDSVRPSRDNKILQAIYALIDHQLGCRMEPWLLYLTTRIDASSLDKSVRDQLLTCVANNMQRYPDFAQELQAEYCLTETDIQLLIGAPATPSDTEAKTIGLGLAKWLLQLLDNQHHRLELCPSYMYTVGPTGPDMISLAFKFVPDRPGIMDSIGLVENSVQSQQQSEGAVARKMIKPLARMVNVDEKLRSDPDLAQLLIDAGGRLLARAGHDPSAYATWASDQV